MTREQAQRIARAVRDALPSGMQRRLKAIHISPHLHQGHTTIRIFTVNQTAPDMEPYIFTAEEI